MTTKFSSAHSTKLLLAALALGVAGCGESDPLNVYQGRVQFVLSSNTDVVSPSSVQGPAATGSQDDDHHHNRFFASANVTFSSILARDLDGVLVDVAMELPTTLDIITMEGGRSITLPEGELPPATYDQVVVVMTELVGITHDSTTITIDPPGGGWTTIVPICPFVVEDGATTVVGLKLSVGRSFAWRENRFEFRPHFVCERDEG